MAPAAALSLLSGAGGVGPRTWDRVKHDAILRDLIVQDWPVRCLTEKGSSALTYYVAYHLPAAVVGQLAGWTAANLAVAATSLVGVTLAVLWLVVFARGAPLLCGGLFTLFSGMDVLGAVLIARWPPRLAQIFADFHLEWWAGTWRYSSNASLLDFVPNQAIAGWLLASLVVDAVQVGRRRLPLAGLPAIGLLWSPFVVIGAVPLALALVLAPKGPIRATLRDQASAANAGGVLLGLVLGLYFASRILAVAIPAHYDPATTPVARGDFWLVPAALGPGAFLVRYAVFVACEFVLLWLLLLAEHRAIDGAFSGRCCGRRG